MDTSSSGIRLRELGSTKPPSISFHRIDDRCSFSRAASKHEIAAKKLANLSLLQSIRSAIPLAVCDFVAIWLVTFALHSLFSAALINVQSLSSAKYAFIAAMFFLPLARLAGMYPALGISPIVEFRQLVRSAVIAQVGVVVAVGCVAAAGWGLSLFVALAASCVCVPVLPVMRYFARSILARTTFWGAPVLICASPPAARALCRQSAALSIRGLRPVGVLLQPEDYWEADVDGFGLPVYNTREALECALAVKATWVLVGASTERSSSQSDEHLPDYLWPFPNRVQMASNSLQIGLWDEAHPVGLACGVRLTGGRRNSPREVLKRASDIVLSVAALALLWPFFVAVVLLIRLSSPGPAFYGQRRVGRNGISFVAWKFRTMRRDAEACLRKCLSENEDFRREWEATHKLKNDPRVTRVGRFLRKTSLDELPQLWNILIGEMSVVGPRPIVDSLEYDAAYIHDYPNEFAAYKTVRPGLTGLWQISCRNNGAYEMRIFWDMYYIRNWSLWLDFYTILRTVRTVLLREGAY